MAKLKEIRVDKIEDAYNYLHFDIISVGNEGCIKKLPIVPDLVKLIKACNSKIKLVLPFIPQAHIEEAKRYVDDIISEAKHLIVIFNDLGLLSYANKKVHNNIIFGIGRYFDWSYNWIPWKNNILRDENINVKNYANSSKLVDKNKIQLYKKMEIEIVELNATQATLAEINWFIENNIQVHIHSDMLLVAVTRACPVKRQNEDLVDCTAKCCTYEKVKFYMKWEPKGSFILNNDKYVLDENIEKHFPILYVKGNLIQRINDEILYEKIEGSKCNVIIKEALFVKKLWEDLKDED